MQVSEFPSCLSFPINKTGTVVIQCTWTAILERTVLSIFQRIEHKLKCQTQLFHCQVFTHLLRNKAFILKHVCNILQMVCTQQLQTFQMPIKWWEWINRMGISMWMGWFKALRRHLGCADPVVPPSFQTVPTGPSLQEKPLLLPSLTTSYKWNHMIWIPQ